MTATTTCATVPNLIEVCRTSTSWAASSLGGSRSDASGWGVQGGGEFASPAESDASGRFVFWIERCRVSPSLDCAGPDNGIPYRASGNPGGHDGRDSSETYVGEALQNSLYWRPAFTHPKVVPAEISILCTAALVRTRFAAGCL